MKKIVVEFEINNTDYLLLLNIRTFKSDKAHLFKKWGAEGKYAAVKEIPIKISSEGNKKILLHRAMNLIMRLKRSIRN